MITSTRKPSPIRSGSPDQTGEIRLAWAGWSLPLPERWHAIKLEGGEKQGSMMIGHSGLAFLRISWKYVGSLNWNPDRWIQKKIREAGVDPERVNSDTPAPGFSPCAWIEPLFEEKKTASRGLWYGYHAASGYVFECVLHCTRKDFPPGQFLKQMLPRLQIQPVGEPHTYQIFGSHFTIPKGYELFEYSLKAGDICLSFLNAEKEKLLVRQVYPAKLALQRRPMEKWLKFLPFKDQKTFRPRADFRETSLFRQSRKNRGLEVTGVKRLPFPLGWISPRETSVLLIHDDAIDRLLIAQHEGRKPCSRKWLETLILQMNSGGIV